MCEATEARSNKEVFLRAFRAFVAKITCNYFYNLLLLSFGLGVTLNKMLIMKKTFTLLVVVFILLTAGAQSYEGTIEYQKKDEKAIVMEFPYPPSVVENAIIARMDKLGHKKKESKGFLIYRDAVLTEISSEPADYLIKVERKSRKDKDESVVYFIVNRNNENILARNDALVNSNAKTFMSRLTPDVDAYYLDMQIKDQEETVSKAEKKLKNLKEDQETIEKKIKKLQEDLKDNTKDQENQQKEVEKQKQNLEDLKGKRKA